MGVQEWRIGSRSKQMKKNSESSENSLRILSARRKII